MLKRYKRVLAVLAGTTMIVSSMTACGSGGDTKSTGSNSEYPELNLSMAVNGTDTQIDTQVGQKLAELCQRSLVVTLRLMYFRMTHWQAVMLPRE